MSELVVVEKKNIETVLTDEGIDTLLAEVRSKVSDVVIDVSDEKGRKELASLARKVAKSKTLVENYAKDYVAELKEKIKPLDGRRKKWRDEMDKIKDEVRAPLTEWENARKEFDNEMEQILAWARPEFPLTSEQIKTKIDEAEAMQNREVLEDKKEDFEFTIFKALKDLNALYDKTLAEEQAKAEAERIEAEKREQERIAREEEIARQAAEKARHEEILKAAEEKVRAKAEQERLEREKKEAELRAIEAERKAEQERQEAKRREAEAEERAKREKEEAARREEERAKQAVEAERRRIEEQKKAEEAEAAKRERDKKHRAAINNAAMLSLISESGLTEDQAKEVVKAIAKGLIDNVSIRY